MAAKKNTEGMAFIVESLKKNKSTTYADIKAAASKKGLKVWPIMFGRAQLLLGHVKGAKRGTGKYARASAAKAAGGSPSGRKPDASSKSGQVRELLKSGMAPMDIAKRIGCTPGLVYNVKSSLSGGAKDVGRQRKNTLPASNGVGFDSILDAVRNTEAQLGRYRTALERINTMLREVLA
jgi:hypothetical protein